MKNEPGAGTVRTIAFRFFFIPALVAVFLCPVMPEQAFSAPQCAPYRQMAEILSRRFGETPRAFGLVGADRILQLFTAPGGSWTILVTAGSGRTCIVAAGEGWEDIPAPQPAVPGDPA